VLGLFLHLQSVLHQCSRKGAVDSFVSLSICVLLATVGVEVAMIVVSLQGSIVDTAGEHDLERKHYDNFVLQAGTSQAGDDVCTIH